MQDDKRSIFDWVIFTFIHLVVLGAISAVGFYVYTWNLGVWVAASATVAGLASCYMFAKDIPGETFMKVILGLAVAANAGYLAHNGAKKIGVKEYNAAQVERYERGIEAAGKAGSRKMAKTLALSVENASKLETIFSDGMATTAAILAFIELACALVIFAISSRRLKTQPAEVRQPSRRQVDEFEEMEIEVRPTGRLEGKEPRR
jgi:hypothetical protein